MKHYVCVECGWWGTVDMPTGGVWCWHETVVEATDEESARRAARIITSRILDERSATAKLRDAVVARDGFRADAEVARLKLASLSDQERLRLLLT